MKTLLNRELSKPNVTVLRVFKEGAGEVGSLLGEGRNPQQKVRYWKGYNTADQLVGTHNGTADEAAKAIFEG